MNIDAEVLNKTSKSNAAMCTKANIYDRAGLSQHCNVVSTLRKQMIHDQLSESRPELASSHGHTELTATCGTLSTERDLKTNQAAPPHQANEKKATWKHTEKRHNHDIHPTPVRGPTRLVGNLHS